MPPDLGLILFNQYPFPVFAHLNLRSPAWELRSCAGPQASPASHAVFMLRALSSPLLEPSPAISKEPHEWGNVLPMPICLHPTLLGHSLRTVPPGLQGTHELKEPSGGRSSRSCTPGIRLPCCVSLWHLTRKLSIVIPIPESVIALGTKGIDCSKAL